MTSISSLGPPTPPQDSRGIGVFEQALAAYARLLSQIEPSHPQQMHQIAQQTVELSKLAQAVMHAASPALRAAAEDLEKLVQAPLSVTTLSKDISILGASQSYLENPASPELSSLMQELQNNRFALDLLCNEFSLLSTAVKNLS